MIRFACASRLIATSLAATILLFADASLATAGSAKHVPVPVPRPSPNLAADAAGGPSASTTAVTTPAPILSIISEDPAPADDTPTIVKSLRHIYCVEYARLRSGIAIFGDAKTWWEKARGLYAEGAQPQPGAVMVFAGTKKMKRGHVAVVRRIVSSREIRVDHANWRRDGNIYLNAPVIDVSANNDWSKVRVWNTRAGQLGSNVYPIRGFVSFRRTAMN